MIPSEIMAVAFLELAVGAALAFLGLRLFRVLLPAWGFVIGFIVGATLAQQWFDQAFLATSASWLTATAIGVACAVLAYAWFVAAVVLLGAGAGYAVATGLLAAVGAPPTLAVTGGLAIGALAGALVILLSVPAYLVISLSAFSGAAGIVNGGLILLGRVGPGELELGPLHGPLQDDSPAVVVWFVLSLIAMLYQLRSMSDENVRPPNGASRDPT